MRMLNEVANRTRVTVDVELDDLKKYDKNNDVLSHIQQNTLRYVNLFSKAIDNVMPAADPNAQIEEDSIDILANWRYHIHSLFLHRNHSQNPFTESIHRIHSQNL